MPLAIGIMQMNRINIYPTITTLINISPSGSAVCGDTVTFSISVVNRQGESYPVPTGTVYIMDANDTSTPLSSGTLVDGYADIDITLYNGSINAYALYAGVNNEFASSRSTPNVLYSISFIDTTTIVTNSSDAYFYAESIFDLTASVAANVGRTIPDGYVQFNLYTDNTAFSRIGVAELDGYGDATLSMPSNTTTAGDIYYIQAIYLGGNCYGSSATSSGTNGTRIRPT